MSTRLIDLKKDLPELYRPGTQEWVEVLVPPMTYLAIDGSGDPNTSAEYATAVAALHTCGYAVRAAVRSRTGVAFVVGPLEGLWSSADPAIFRTRDKAAWSWTMLIPLPSLATTEDLDTGLPVAAARKPELPIGQVRVQEFDEGRSLQIMHHGSYDDEGPTLARLHQEVMPTLGVTWNGPHHEIYLSDPRRVAADRLRTVLRQPVRPC